MRAAPVAPVCGRLFHVRGAAEYLGITESRARALIAAGDLVAVRKASGRVEGVYQVDCDAWIAQRRAAPAPVVTYAVDTEIAALLPARRVFS
jgi:hypothetical protein